MSVAMRQMKSETVELSDSDSDRLQIEEAPTCDEGAVRRSSRTRRTSKRFIAEDFSDPETTTAKKKPRKTTAATSGGVKTLKAVKREVEDVDPLREPEPIDPHVLVTYAQKSNRLVSPGQFNVKLPVGPTEFVTVDGAEYLRGLGYYSLIKEEDDEVVEDGTVDISAVKLETERFGEALKKRQAAFDAQKPKKNNSSPQNNFRIKEDDDQFSSASAYSSDEDENSRKSSSDVDVITGSPPRETKGGFPVPESPIIELDDESLNGMGLISTKSRIRFVHNQMEKMRRQQLSKCFDYVRDCIVYPHGLTREMGSKAPKVKILHEGALLIRDLRLEAKKLADTLDPLTKSNKELRKRYDELEAMLKGLKPKLQPAKKTGPAGKIKLKSRKSGKAGAPTKRQSSGVLNSNEF